MEAVIDAVVELARDGRQVFFLTARQDEAERWTARLRASAVDHGLIDLGETRRMARFGDLPPLPATRCASARCPPRARWITRRTVPC